jgi:hypothetical protein
LEFYEDEAGRKPVLEWLRDQVSISTRRVVDTALREILQEQGVRVCGTCPPSGDRPLELGGRIQNAHLGGLMGCQIQYGLFVETNPELDRRLCRTYSMLSRKISTRCLSSFAAPSS